MEKEYENIEQFAQAALVIIIRDILELDIVIPRLIFDYSIDCNKTCGYYMYQNVSSNIITLNMTAIQELKYENDIKTVITYGFIHEIVHMFHPISSKYKTKISVYSYIEDNIDAITIELIRNNINLIDNRLNFTFNTVFLKGIERQLKYDITNEMEFKNHAYISKSIAGALAGKLNVNFDYLYKMLIDANSLKVVFPDKREYYIDMDYGTAEELDILINLIYLTNIRMINVKDERLIAYDMLIDLELVLY